MRVALQDVAVFFDGDATARGVHHNGFDVTGFHQRPPGVDIGAHLCFAAVLVVQMEFHRAAAAGFGGYQGLDARSVQYAAGGGVDIGRHGGLHTAF